MLAVLAVIGCSNISHRPNGPNGPTSPARPAEYDLRKHYPKLQKYFHTGLHRVYSASKAALRDLGWQIVTDRLLGRGAKIEAQQGAERKTTIFVERVTPVRTRVAVLVNGASASRGSSIASNVHQRIATILRIKAED